MPECVCMHPSRSWRRRALGLALLVCLFLVVPGVNAQTAGVLSVEGDELLDQGKYEEAIGKYDQALALEPNLAMAWVGKGLAKNGLEEFGDALDAFEMAISINPGYAKAWYGKGVALFELGRYEDSIAAFDRALEIYPEYGYILYYSKANAFYALEDYRAAIPLYEKALTLKPDYAPGWTRLGEALYSSGDYEGALAAFDKGLALDQNDTRAQAGMTAAKEELSGSVTQPMVEGTTASAGATSGIGTPARAEAPVTPTTKAPISLLTVVGGLLSGAALIRMRDGC